MSYLPCLGDVRLPVALPNSVRSHLDGAGPEILSKGWVTSRNKAQVGVLFRGSSLEVVSVHSNERLSAWTFRSPGNAGSSEITCCEPVFMGDSQPLLLAVGLASGLVCVFDTRTSRVVRAIQVRHRVSAVASVAPAARPGTADSPVLHFCGVLAVGTQEGHVFLLDLCLDDYQPPEDEDFADLPALESDETSPAETYDPLTSDSGNWSLLRQESLVCGRHLCLSLNGFSYIKSNGATVFQHRCKVSGETVHFPQDGVVVSALKYVPQIQCLLVGYNFGSWQMLDWNEDAAVFSSSYNLQNSLPITHFVFQEPENDPRNFCYVWTVQCENDFDTEKEKNNGGLDSKATTTLHALSFKDRDVAFDDVKTTLFSGGLTSCGQRFKFNLESDPLEANFAPVGSLCLGCYALEEPGSTPGSDLDDLEQRVNEQLCNSGLAVFLWQVYARNQPQPKHYLGVFDLNAWYQVSLVSWSQFNFKHLKFEDKSANEFYT